MGLVLQKNEGHFQSFKFLCRVFTTTLFLEPAALLENEGHIQSFKLVCQVFTTTLFLEPAAGLWFRFRLGLACFGFADGAAWFAVLSL